MYTPRFVVVSRTRFPPGLRFVGEVDASNASLMIDMIERADQGIGELHVDVSKLDFCDASSIRALVTAIRGSASSRRIVLHGIPEQLERALKVIGWGDVLGHGLRDNH